MPCQLNNHSNTDLSSLEPHVQGMYDYFNQKIGFQKPPTMHFDSDPSNQASVLGKTAYYDPSNLEIHVFTDGRHPKDMLRSIAHELIHHQQNLEGRLDVGGYMGEGYYLKNEAMRELEQEAMLEGNALMREYEDTVKSEEMNKMSLKEWKNNELNQLLLKKFGIIKETKGEKGDANPLDGEREKFDKDLDGVPDGADKDKDDPEVKEEGLDLRGEKRDRLIQKAAAKVAAGEATSGSLALELQNNRAFKGVKGWKINHQIKLAAKKLAGTHLDQQPEEAPAPEEAPEEKPRSFMQKAGSFMTGKGFNEEQLDEYSYEDEYRDREAYKNSGPRKRAEPYTPPEEKELSYSEKRAQKQKERGQRTMRAAGTPRQIRRLQKTGAIRESLKRLAKAKSITVRGKKIK
jgi:hypothetical protein